MTKSKEPTISDVLQAVNNGFSEMQKNFNNLDQRVCNLEEDMVWVKEILENQSTFLKRLDEDRLFMFNRQNRLENKIEKIKSS